MAHTGKTGCKLICVCSEADETVFFCTSPPPPLPPQFSYMKCHKQHKPWDKRVLCLQRQSWGWEDQNCGVEYFPPAFPCDPEPDTLLFYSSVPVPVFSACFHFVGEMCMWGGGGYLKSTMSFVRVRSSVGEVLKSHFIHSLEPHPRWSF